MADATPNYHLEQQRLRSQIASLRATIEQQRLAILEMIDRRAKHEENIEASERSIHEYEAKLLALEQEHGKLSDSVFDRR